MLEDEGSGPGAVCLGIQPGLPNSLNFLYFIFWAREFPELDSTARPTTYQGWGAE